MSRKPSCCYYKGCFSWLTFPLSSMKKWFWRKKYPCSICGISTGSMVVWGWFDDFSWHKLKNDMPKIKWLLFLKSFDCRHNPGLSWKAIPWGLLSKSQNHNITETKLQKLKHSESECFCSHWKCFMVSKHNGAKSRHWANSLSILFSKKDI